MSFQTVNIFKAPERPAQFLTEGGLRRDGRGINQFRNIFLKTGVLNQASGSAYIEINQTKVLCAVHGPHQSTKLQFNEEGRLNCEFKYASFSCADTRRKFAQERDEKEFSRQMLQALENSVRLELYPKSLIDIYAFVLESGGATLAAALTAASLALADAGIEMFDLVSACAAAKVDGAIVLDPDEVEEKYQSGGLTVALMPSLNEITQLYQSGELEYEKAIEAQQLCLDGCAKLYSLMTHCLKSEKSCHT